jgi:hypothetical protein
MRRAARAVAACLIAVIGVGNAPGLRATLRLLASGGPCARIDILHSGAPPSVTGETPARRIIAIHEIQRRASGALPPSLPSPVAATQLGVHVATVVFLPIDSLSRDSVYGRAPPLL